MLEHHKCKNIPLLVSTRRLLMHVSMSVTEPSPLEPSQCPRNHNTWNSRFSWSPCLAMNRAELKFHHVSSAYLSDQVDVITVSEANLIPLACSIWSQHNPQFTRTTLSFLTAAISHSVASVKAKAWDDFGSKETVETLASFVEFHDNSCSPSGWIHGISPPMISSC